MTVLKEKKKYEAISGDFPWSDPWFTFRRKTPEGLYIFDSCSGKEVTIDEPELSVITLREVFVPKIYLASGWFNPEQKKQMNEVYDVLKGLKNKFVIDFFSPFYDGTVLKKDDPDLRKKMKDTWELDIREIESSDMLVVCTQDHDVGTIFEAGYASAWGRSHGKPIPILCYNSKPELGLNLMLCQEARGFAKTTEELARAIEDFCATKFKLANPWKWNRWEGEPI